MYVLVVRTNIVFILLEFLSSRSVATRTQILDLKSYISQHKPSSPPLPVPSALLVSDGGEAGSGGRLSHGRSRRVPPCCLHPDEDLLGAGATQETHFPQTKRETGAGDELKKEQNSAQREVCSSASGAGCAPNVLGCS